MNFPVWAILLLPFVFVGTFAAVVITIVVKTIKRQKQSNSLSGRVSTIVNKALDNIEGELDKHKPEKVVMVNCPFCGTPNKDTDAKCSSCKAPLSK